MSVAIKNAVRNLGQSVGNLEGSLGSLEEALAGQQRDMFGGPANSNGSGNGVVNGNGAQAAIVAKRLDHAIEKVEQLLAEG